METSSIRKSIKQVIIILLVNSVGFFGFEILSFSERIVNRRMNSFFSRLAYTKANRLILIQNRVKLNRVLSDKFSNKISSEFLSFIIEVIIGRENGIKVTHRYIDVSLVSNLINEKRMKIEDYFLLSKLLSKLGEFELAHEIDNRARFVLLSNGFYSIYSLFQTIKCILQEEDLILLDYLSVNNLINHFNKFYKINQFLNNVNCLKKEDVIYVLGPLRTMADYYNYRDKNIAVLKPRRDEVEFLLNIRYKNCYLYTFKPIEFKIDVDPKLQNVYSHKSKEKSNNFSLSANYYNSFLILNGYPSGLSRALLHQVFETANNLFYVEFLNFYLSKDFYSDNYRDGRKNLGKMESTYEIKKFIWGIGWHDLLANFKFTKFLQTKKIIINSEFTGEVLNLSSEEYALALEKLFSF